MIPIRLAQCGSQVALCTGLPARAALRQMTGCTDSTDPAFLTILGTLNAEYDHWIASGARRNDKYPEMDGMAGFDTA